jgi:hypothetical protein
LISVNRIFIKDYKVSVSIWHIRSESRVIFEMPQLSDLQKCVRLRDGVSIRAIAEKLMFEWHFEKRHFQYHLQSQKFGVVKVSEFSTAATVHNTVFWKSTIKNHNPRKKIKPRVLLLKRHVMHLELVSLRLKLKNFLWSNEL